MPHENHPELWIKKLPVRGPQSHKYTHGHAVILGAEKMTGATRLAAESCARAGAGLTSVLSPPQAAEIYRKTLAAHIIVKERSENLTALLQGERITAVLAGPGAGADYVAVRRDVKDILKTQDKTIILDADALNALESLEILDARCILTPHQGEFEKLFPSLRASSKEDMAQEAASAFGGVVVYKGAETVIATPQEIVVNKNAPPNLSTAGTGDVLAGIITGLAAQGMEPFWAACAGVWIHAEAARRFGAGLVASDLTESIPAVLRDLS